MDNREYYECMIRFPNYCIIYKEDRLYIAKDHYANILHSILGANLKYEKNTLFIEETDIQFTEDTLRFHKISYLIIEAHKIITSKDFEDKNSYRIFLSKRISETLTDQRSSKTNDIYSNNEILTIINSLLKGINTNTGESFESDSIIYDLK